jgi:hypothetical protein
MIVTTNSVELPTTLHQPAVTARPEPHQTFQQLSSLHNEQDQKQ